MRSADIDPTAGFALTTTSRLRRWLRGCRHRLAEGDRDRSVMLHRHEEQEAKLRDDLQAAQQATLEACRRERQQVLQQWDQIDEKLLARYESETLRARNQRHRELVVFRRDRKRAVESEEQAYDTEKSRLQQKYQEEKPKPAALQHKGDAQLDSAAQEINLLITALRQLAARRLGGPAALEKIVAASSSGKSPSMPRAATTGSPSSPNSAAADAAPPSPGDLAAVLKQLGELLLETKSLGQQMKQGFHVKLVESIFLLWIIIPFVLLWCLVCYLGIEAHRPLWMLGSLPAAALVAGVIHLLAGIPLRRQTRELYPALEDLAAATTAEVHTGKQGNAALAARQQAQLKKHFEDALQRLHDRHGQTMEETVRHFKEKETELLTRSDQLLLNLETQFRENFSSENRAMVEAADRKAAALTERLQQLNEEGASVTAKLKQRHAEEVARLEYRMQTSMRRSVARGAAILAAFEARFPPWNEVVQGAASEGTLLRNLPLGKMQIGRFFPAQFSARPESSLEELPVVLPRQVQAGVVIDAHPAQMHLASELVRTILWRALSAVKPGRLRLTLLDPIGHGQNFASLTALADHDPQLIGHRAWSATGQIAARLQELTQHIEDILQTCLRDRYATIEHYNREATAIEEPYRIVAAIGLPAGLNHEGYDALRALIEGGRRCGIFLILVRDLSQPWPAELPPLPETQLLRLIFDEAGELRHQDPELREYAIRPLDPPPQGVAAELAERIGQGALHAQRIEIPLRLCINPEEVDRGNSEKGLLIPVGRQGVGRTLDVDLGSGMRQHVLVAGKTGSGKSTLLHCLITAAALKYSPDQLHLYLLDFKKGVEFKIYAQTSLPHARVIGIESQREFGLSVLERLDEELQTRGEAFRGAGVQDLGDYRRRTGKTLPRILLVIDEFQELFVRDDRLAQECTMLLDRLVRQGRSFGLHVVLSSQSLAGTYSLPRATLGQMAIRIALQCSESDAAMILSDDNTAARLLSRPGEAIFNDAGGLIEGNEPFQVAWLESASHRAYLEEIAARHAEAMATLGPAVVFEGNRPASWHPQLADSMLAAAATRAAGGIDGCGLIGEAVRIGPPSQLVLNDASGRNVLAVGDPASIHAVLTSWIPTILIDGSRRSGRIPRLVLFTGQRENEVDHPLGSWLAEAGIPAEVIRPRERPERMIELAGELAAGNAPGNEPGGGERVAGERPLTLVIIHPLERFRDFRQDDSFGFSLDASSEPSAAVALQTLLRDGPAAGMHTLVTCNGAETLSRWLPRSSHHDLELRLLGRLNATDSAQLMDSPEATNLSPATMLLYDDADGRIEKFRMIAPPSPLEVRDWFASHLEQCGKKGG